MRIGRGLNILDLTWFEPRQADGWLLEVRVPKQVVAFEQ